MKNRIVVDVRMINSSGIGTYLKNILPEVAKVFDLTLLGNQNELLLFKWANDCKIINFNAKIYSISEQLQYPLIIPRTELFWCPHFNVPIFPIKANKIISTIHDLNHIALNKKKVSIEYFYAKFLYNNAIKKSNKIITVSNFSKSELIKYLKLRNNKIEVIHCGVSKKFLVINQAKLKLNLPEKYILFVGNIKPHKNLIILLKAYNKLPKEITKIYKLVILGKKEGFRTPDKEIFNFIDRNKLSKDIYFTGYIDDDEVPIIYKRAEIFVFPSLYEGFGLPILEAMASEIPVLSSNSASLQEIGGDASIYFNPHKSDELQQKIELLLKDDKLKKTYLKRGLNQIKLFSWKKSSKKHIAAFKEIINEENTNIS